MASKITAADILKAIGEDGVLPRRGIDLSTQNATATMTKFGKLRIEHTQMGPETTAWLSDLVSRVKMYGSTFCDSDSLAAKLVGTYGTQLTLKERVGGMPTRFIVDAQMTGDTVTDGRFVTMDKFVDLVGSVVGLRVLFVELVFEGWDDGPKGSRVTAGFGVSVLKIVTAEAFDVLPPSLPDKAEFETSGLKIDAALIDRARAELAGEAPDSAASAAQAPATPAPKRKRVGGK